MLQNYIKIALRNIFRNKVFSFINIIGLSIGLACCMLIFLFTKDELSFDQFHEKKENIYQLTCKIIEKNPKETEANTFASEQLIDEATWDEFSFRYRQPIDNEFSAFAKEFKLHPAILLGRYCHTRNKYNLRSTIDRKLN